MGHRYSLGLEFSTQSVKMVVLDVDGLQLIHKASFDFDTHFPHYLTVGGVLPSDTNERHAPPLMFLEALDKAFLHLQENVDLSKLEVIKIDAQQHCSVYLNKTYLRCLSTLNASTSTLLGQFGACFARISCPIWEDRSTAREAKQLSDSFDFLSETGNKVELRFPAAQILKFKNTQQKEFQDTAHIQLLSAFLTSLLCANIAPVDTGDGWGTNLNTLSISTPAWNKKLTDWIAPGLIDALGEMQEYDTLLSKICVYFVDKYGVNRDAVILAGTGDNPASLLATGGARTISLGSSYTINGVMADNEPFAADFNVFGFCPGIYMSLVCFSNGGKLHEIFLRKYLGLSEKAPILTTHWKAIETLAKKQSFGQYQLLPYWFDESVPVAKAGLIRDGFGDEAAEKNISALYFSQVASLYNHSRFMRGGKDLCVVGGGSNNKVFRQLLCDVFQAKTFLIKDAQYAAPLGCAISGARRIMDCSYEDVIALFMQKQQGSCLEPQLKESARLLPLLEKYQTFETKHLNCS